jgi:hypothetical protein
MTPTRDRGRDRDPVREWGLVREWDPVGAWGLVREWDRGKGPAGERA